VHEQAARAVHVQGVHLPSWDGLAGLALIADQAGGKELGEPLLGHKPWVQG